MSLLDANYHDMLSALLGENAEFLLIGAFAVSAHGVPRNTGDIDIFVRNTPDNAGRVWRALLKFGAPLAHMHPTDFESEDLFYQIGVVPCRIDILTSIDGVTFDEAWTTRIVVNIDDLDVPVLGKDTLIRNKLAAGRPKDVLDVKLLEKHRD